MDDECRRLGSQTPEEAEQTRAARTTGSCGKATRRDRVRGGHVTASPRSCHRRRRRDRVPGRGHPDQAIRVRDTHVRCERRGPSGIGRRRRPLEPAHGRAHSGGHPGSPEPRPDRDAASHRSPPSRSRPARPSSSRQAPTSVHLTVTVPAGWERAGLGMYVKPDDAGPIGLSIGAYEIAHVNMFPCRWASGQFTDTAYPHTAAGQAQALTAFWGQDPNQTPFFSNSSIAPIATKPSPATIGGYPAWRLQILIPSTFDFSACDGGQLVLWETADGTSASASARARSIGSGSSTCTASWSSSTPHCRCWHQRRRRRSCRR